MRVYIFSKTFLKKSRMKQSNNVDKFNQESIFSQDSGEQLSLLEKARLIIFTPLYVAFGTSVLAASPLLAFVSRISDKAKFFIFWVCFKTIIPSLRYFLDSVPTWLVLTWWMRSKNISQDGRVVMEDVALGSPRYYGSHPRMWVQSLHPIRRINFREDRHVLFVHGGGFVAANCILLMPSVTPWVRQNYTVWCMNYPLSPAAVFPEAALSVIKCMRMLRKEYGVRRLVLTGDSAGGSLVTVAACFLSKPEVFLKKYEDESVYSTPVPQVLGVLSMYGLLDRSAPFEKDVVGISKFEQFLSRFALNFLFVAYTGKFDFLKDEEQNKCTLVDLVNELDCYPRTLLIVGTRDILVHSSRRAHRVLTERGFDSKLLEYDARHAFVGLPPALNIGGEHWKHHSKPATEECIKFFDELDW